MPHNTIQYQSKRIKYRIIVAFALGMVLIISFGVTIFYLSAEASQSITDAHGLTYGVDSAAANNITQNVERISHLSFLFFTLGSVFFMTLMFNLMFSITPALRRITLAVKEVGNGNFKYRIKLPVDNELGDMSRILNQALDKVLQSEHELQQEKAAVEHTVEIRTKQLKLERAKFLASIKALPVGFILTDPDGRIAMINPVMGELLQLNAETDTEFNKNVENAGSFLKQLLAKTEEVINDSQTSSADFETTDGKFLTALYSPVALKEQGFGGVVIVLEDVTETKNLERSKDEFFSIASHELRTPLTAIRGNAELMKEFYKEQLHDERFARIIDGIES